MKTSNRILALTSALLLGIAVLPAYALDVNVGGVGVSTSTGGGNVASASATTSGDTNADIIITNNDGSLVDLQNEDDTATGTVNLGGLGAGDIDGLGDAGVDLGGLLGGLPGGDGTTVAETQVATAFNALSGSEQALLNNKCRSVMIDPSRFNPSLVALCRLIVRIR